MIWSQTARVKDIVPTFICFNILYISCPSESLSLSPVLKGTITYPVCYLFLQKRLDDGKYSLEYARFIYNVDGFYSNWKTILGGGDFYSCLETLESFFYLTFLTLTDNTIQLLPRFYLQFKCKSMQWGRVYVCKNQIKPRGSGTHLEPDGTLGSGDVPAIVSFHFLCHYFIPSPLLKKCNVLNLRQDQLRYKNDSTLLYWKDQLTTFAPVRIPQYKMSDPGFWGSDSLDTDSGESKTLTGQRVAHILNTAF